MANGNELEPSSPYAMSVGGYIRSSVRLVTDPERCRFFVHVSKEGRTFVSLRTGRSSHTDRHRSSPLGSTRDKLSPSRKHVVVALSISTLCSKAVISGNISMEWTPEVTSEFIDLYEAQPILWNPKHPLHKQRQQNRDAWRRIQKQFSRQITIEELKKKESLTATFRTQLRKVKESSKSGAGTEDIYKPSWFAFQRMATFLSSVNLARKTINTEDLNEHTLDKPQEVDEVDEVLDESMNGTLENVEEPTSSASNESLKSPPSAGAVDKRARLSKMEQIIKQMSHAYSVLSSVTTKQAKDSCSLYGELLAIKLREFDEYTRAIAMNDIDNILFRLKMQVSQMLPPAHYSNSFFRNQPSSTPSHDYQQQPVLQPHTQQANRNSTIPPTSFSPPCYPSVKFTLPHPSLSYASSSSSHSSLNHSPHTISSPIPPRLSVVTKNKNLPQLTQQYPSPSYNIPISNIPEGSQTSNSSCEIDVEADIIATDGDGVFVNNSSAD